MGDLEFTKTFIRFIIFG
ncbi:hypothetical protein Gotur_013622 [Gossypium turneri]